MPFGTERIAATYAREILRVVSGSEVAENAVVDGQSVALDANNRRILETGQVMVYAGVNEIQTLAIAGGAGADTYTLTYSGQTTAAIDWDATAAEVEAALVALSNIAAGDVSVQGPAGGPFKIYFGGALAATNVGQLTSAGTGVTLTHATTRAGAVAVAGAGQKVKPSITTDDDLLIAGILMHTTEFLSEAGIPEQYDAPVALYTKNCHFAAAELTGYTGNEANVKLAMTGAGNGKCANCTIE